METGLTKVAPDNVASGKKKKKKNTQQTPTQRYIEVL